MREYEELVGALFAVVPPALTLLILIVVTALIAAGWYWYPAWIPRRLPRLPRWKRKPRQDKKVKKAAPARKKEDRKPPVVAPAAITVADRLAAEGRYAEAIRERLRDTVTALTRAGVIDPDPGTTAAEITDDAITGRPGVGPAMTAATSVFSGVWYGHQPAGPGEDERMRAYTTEVQQALGEREKDRR
ncbi:DUF4129 domain-containing protein [Actinoplanes sp. G11-F43]|uniref:DUF4129 domain-containing protein n=1 Tax=Actinoplanes sp. G11-F43 TaxID=3424130 RepID=UPI003D33418B